MEKKFKTNELVWAKIRGYPYWPAVVNKILTYLINNKIRSETFITTAIMKKK